MINDFYRTDYAPIGFGLYEVRQEVITVKLYETPEQTLFPDRPDELRIEALKFEIQLIEKRLAAKPTNLRLKAVHQQKLKELEKLTTKCAGIIPGRIEKR